MCGIFCAFSEEQDRSSCLYDNYLSCKENLKHRGPDFNNIVCETIYNVPLIFAASVLWLQGDALAKQPVENENGIFVYNGDIFNYTESCERNFMESDTKILMRLLQVTSVFHAFSTSEGPFAFVYLDKKLSRLYFGRDHYGRRSLLMGKHENMYTITSIGKRDSMWKYIELPAIGIFYFDLIEKTFHLTPWKERNENFKVKLNEIELFLNISIKLNEECVCKDKITFREPQNGDFNVYEQIQSPNFLNSIEYLLRTEKWLLNVQTLERALSHAVEKRVLIQPKFCNNCISKEACDHSLTGILFSGGIDCAILAFLCDKYTNKERPIDLLNVAFSKTGNYNTPDRLTGLNTLRELQRLCPDRKWNFVKIDVPEDELNQKRSEYIADLIYPLNTVLDDSLGCALWFASRGKNFTYKSTCRVLLVGMGADELFGGYTKHRNSLKRGGWLALFKSLEEDWQNLPHRNLARDDRVVSDHGRQLRTPYLDENVVSFVRNLNCWERTYPTENVPQGLGEKILLRSLAYKLGLREAAFLKKRAFQFGSRIANSKENAKNLSPRL